MGISSEGKNRINQLVVAMIDETIDRQTGDGVLHAIRLMTGSNDRQLSEHATNLLDNRVNLDNIDPIVLDPESVELFRRIYLHGSGITPDDGKQLKNWIETGNVS